MLGASFFHMLASWLKMKDLRCKTLQRCQWDPWVRSTLWAWCSARHGHQPLFSASVQLRDERGGTRSLSKAGTCPSRRSQGQVSPGGWWEARTSRLLLRAGQTLSVFGWIAGVAFAQIPVEGEKVPSQALIVRLIWHFLKTKDILPWTLALNFICFVARYPLSFIGLFQVGTKGPRSLPDPILVLSVHAILVCTGFTETEIWIFSVI